MPILVRGSSGTLYRIDYGYLERLDGLGRRVASTCWQAPAEFPWVDRVWAMSLSLQYDEARVLREFPWRTYGQEA